jgi:hypothetical protein
MTVRPDLIELPELIRVEASRLADERGVTLQQWVTEAVSDKLRGLELSREFFRLRAKRGSTEDLRAILAKVPDKPPMPGDEIN